MSVALHKIPLEELTKLPQEAATTLWIDEKKEVIVIRRGQEFEVYSSICPHMGAPLQFDSRSGELACPWHGLRFDLAMGRTNHHCYRHVKKYKAEIKENYLEIQP